MPRWPLRCVAHIASPRSRAPIEEQGADRSTRCTSGESWSRSSTRPTPTEAAPDRRLGGDTGGDARSWEVNWSAYFADTRSMVVRAYDDQRASWSEGCPAEAATQLIADRVTIGQLTDRRELGLTVKYGSPVVYRLMGGLFTTRWVPVKVDVTVTPQGQSAAVKVVGGDEKGAYLFEASRRRGKSSISERFFVTQFRHACSELSGGAWAPT